MISRIRCSDWSGKIRSARRRPTSHPWIFKLARVFSISISFEWQNPAFGFRSIHSHSDRNHRSWNGAIKSRRIFKYRIRSHMHTHNVALQQGCSICLLKYVNRILILLWNYSTIDKTHQVDEAFCVHKIWSIRVDAAFDRHKRLFSFTRTPTEWNDQQHVSARLKKKKNEFIFTIVTILIVSISGTIISDLFIVRRQCLKDTRSPETIHSSTNRLYMRTTTDFERRETISINAIRPLIIRLLRLTSVLVHFLLGKSRPSSRCFSLSCARSHCFSSLVNRRMDSTFSAHIQRTISTASTEDHSFSLSLSRSSKQCTEISFLSSTTRVRTYMISLFL